MPVRLHPVRIKLVLAFIALRSLPIGKWIYGWQDISGSTVMPVPVALITNPQSIDMLLVCPFFRIARSRFHRHSKRGHQTFQPALCGDTEKMVGIGIPLHLKQPLSVVRMPPIGINEISRQWIPPSQQ